MARNVFDLLKGKVVHAMKPTCTILTLALCLSNCHNHAQMVNGNSADKKPAMDSMAFQKLNKLFVVGDFDGDGIRDTVFQHTVSLRTGKEIVHTPDPFQHEWDNMVKWFDDQEAEVYLTMNIQNPDTLHLGFAQGLYGLINVGDNNADGRDEIALVIDHLDFSAVNSCKIFSLCKGQWTLLKQFGVLEDAFVLTDEQVPVFDQIEGFLENRNGKWMYRDYLPKGGADQKGDENMTLLILDKCH